MPLASLGTAQRSPAGRRAISNWAFATSIPTKHGTSTRGTPVCPTLQIRAQWHQTTVRARGVQDVTTHAPLRSRWTKAKSVYHVRGLRGGDSPTSPTKDTRLFWEQVARQQLLHNVQFVLNLQAELATTFEEALALVRLHRTDNCFGRDPMMECDGG